MNDQARVDELLDRWEEHWEQGEEIAVDVLCEDAPELADEVQFQIRALKGTNWLFEPNDEDCDFLSLPPIDTLMKQAELTVSIPGSVSLDEFTASVVTSGLMTGEQLSTFRERSDVANAQGLVDKLIREKKLTPYQAKAVVDGNTKGLVLGNYVILDKIGAGGMGQVYLARHQRMKRIVALKVLPEAAVESANAVERFHREVEAAAQLGHPNIVTAHDADEASGFHFLVMEHVDGDDLSDVVRKRGPLSVAKAVNCIIQTARGLEYAHKQGIIHRDIKPGNLLLDSEGTVKILDMGLARLQSTNGTDGYAPTQAELTQNGSVFGTVDYMSPEQALNSKDVDARADIYSLGCSLYYLLTGQSVYHGDSLMAKMLAHREADIPVLHKEREVVPERLSEIFAKMVAKKVEDRYPTMSALLADLEALAEEVVEEDEPEVAAADAGSVSVSSVDLQSKETSSASIGDTVDYTGHVALKPAKPKPLKDGMPRLAWFAGGGVAAIALAILGYLYFAGIIFTVETPDGIIQIETNVTDVEIYVDNEKVVYITDPKDKTKIRVEIPKSAETLRVSKEGFEADVKEFRLKTVKGPVKVSFVPVEKPSVGGDAHRQVAEWVLGIGGTVRVATKDGDAVATNDLRQLPDEAFRVHIISVSGISDFTDDHLTELGRLCRDFDLHQLSLRGTAITDEGIAELAGLSIQRLALVETQSIGDAGIRYVKQVRNLEELSVSRTTVGDEGVREIATIRSLNALDLRGTPATDSALEHLEQLTELKSLDVTGTNISNDGLRHLAVHRNLRILYAFSCDQITDAGLKHLAGLTALESLDLSYNKRITDAGIVELAELGELSKIVLNNCGISDTGLQTISEQFPNLSSLHLGGTDISDAGLEHLAELPRLEVCHLDGTQVSDEGIAKLVKLKKLERVDLRNTKVTAQGVAQLQKALPNCKIDYVADPHRAVAEWVLEIGGEVQLVGQTVFTTLIEDLPEEAFKVHNIRVPANFTDEHLAELCRLCQGIDLHSLSLRETAVADDGLAHLAGLSIGQLDLHDTEITNAGIKYVQQVLNLKELWLSDTRVTDEGVREIATIESLGSLFLNGTPISDMALEHLKRSPNLTSLSINGTSISDEGLRHLSVHRSLRSLWTINCAQITDAGMKHLSGLTELAKLDLYGTKVTDAGIVELANLNNLNILSLKHCKVTDAGLQSISEQFPILSVLILGSTQVSDAGIAILARLKKLDHVDLTNTKVTAQGVAELQKALPNCRIEWGEDASSDDPMPLEFEDGDLR